MANGDFSAVIDTLEFDGTSCYYLDFIHVSGDVCAVVYNGPSNVGYLKTFDIDEDGNIGAVIDTLTVDASYLSFPTLIHVTGNIYLIAYQGPDSDGWACTVTINTNGQIDDSIIDTLEFDAVFCHSPRLIHISGTTYAVAYCGGANTRPTVKTFAVESDGQIGVATIDSVELDANTGYHGDIVHVSGDVYATVWRGGGDDHGWMWTIDIDSSGNIGAVIDSLEFDTSGCYFARILKVSGTVYAISYTGPDSDGWLCTVVIENDGQIAAAVTDTFEFDESKGDYSSIRLVAGDIYVIVYRGHVDRGWAKTLTIADDGTIGAVIDSLEFESPWASFPTIINVQGDVYAVAYQDEDLDGWVATFTIAIQHTLTMAVSPTGGGTTDPTVGEHDYDVNEVVTLIATPNDSWYFYEWAGDKSGSINPTSITMDADKSVTAVFKRYAQIWRSPDYGLTWYECEGVTDPQAIAFGPFDEEDSLVAAGSEAVLYEYYITGLDANFGVSDTFWGAQTFTPLVSHHVGLVRVKMSKQGSSDVTVTIEIQETTAGKPNGVVLATGTFQSSDITWADYAYEWVAINLTTNPWLSSGVKYAIVMYCSADPDPSYVFWGFDTSSAAYGNGSKYWSNDAGGSWWENADDDFIFEEWDAGSSEVYIYNRRADTEKFVYAFGDTISGLGQDIETDPDLFGVAYIGADKLYKTFDYGGDVKEMYDVPVTAIAIGALKDVYSTDDRSFFGITIVEFAPVEGSWQEVDASPYIPAGATGVIVRYINESNGTAAKFGLRKKGSTDDRWKGLSGSTQGWAMIGVDGDRKFEALWDNDIDPSIVAFYIYGYTMEGVTFLTDGVSVSPATGSWVEIDTSATCPNAIGIILEVEATHVDAKSFGVRMKGSTDEIYFDTYRHNCFTVVIGCDENQKIEIKREDAAIGFYIVGYITAGAVFNTNAQDVSITATGELNWEDLNGVFDGIAILQVVGGGNYDLRKDGTIPSIDDSYASGLIRWAILEASSDGLLEGRRQTTDTKFYYIGRAYK
jgi:hypothetical protein